MDNSFDRSLRKKLEDQQPESLGYRPDREKIWQQIAGKQKRKVLAFPSWLSHTAAVAAGLAVGIFLLYRPADEKQPVVAGTVTPVRSAVKTITDTVYLTQQAQATVAINPGNSISKASVHTVPLRQPVPRPLPQLPEPSLPASHPAQEVKAIPVAAAAPQQKKVLYLSDMDNENTMPKPRVKEHLAFLKILSNQSGTDTENETVSIALGRQLFGTAKN